MPSEPRQQRGASAASRSWLIRYDIAAMRCAADEADRFDGYASRAADATAIIEGDS